MKKNLASFGIEINHMQNSKIIVNKETDYEQLNNEFGTFVKQILD